MKMLKKIMKTERKITMEKFKQLVIEELKKMRTEQMYNSFEYQILDKAIRRVEALNVNDPAVDDGK